MFANQAQAVGAAGRHFDLAPDTGNHMAAMTLDDLGMIYDCNRESETLFGYLRSEMVLQHVSMLLPQLVELELMQKGRPNSRLRFLSRTGHLSQAVTRNGERFSCKLFFNLLDGTRYSRISLIVRPAEKAPSDRKQQVSLASDIDQSVAS